MTSFVDYCIGFKTNFCRASKLSKHFPQNKKKKQTVTYLKEIRLIKQVSCS